MNARKSRKCREIISQEEYYHNRLIELAEQWGALWFEELVWDFRGNVDKDRETAARQDKAYKKASWYLHKVADRILESNTD